MTHDSIKVKSLRPLHDSIIVADMNFKERSLSSGLILLGDDGKSSGIRARWAQVYAVGPDQTDVQVGQWVCVAHGRWTRGVKISTDDGEHTIRKIDPKEILMVSDERPRGDDSISNAILGEAA